MSLIKDLLQTLIDMRFLSEGRSSAAPDAVRGRTSEPDYRPRLAGESLFEQYAGDKGELRLLLYRMQRDLQRAKKARRGGERKEERDQRILKEYDGWPSRKVAEYEGLSHTTICQIRQEAEGRSRRSGS